MPADSPTIEHLFQEALRHSAGAERRGFLDGACGDDAGLRDRVEALLSAHDGAGAFLERPVMSENGVTQATAPSEGPGTVIDRYKLLQVIGEGGFGVVYMAEQTVPVKRRVALNPSNTTEGACPTLPCPLREVPVQPCVLQPYEKCLSNLAQPST